MNLPSKIEALLFAEGSALSFKKLAHLLGCNETELNTALEELATRLHGGGLTVVRTDKEAALAVSPETSEAVIAARSRETERDIGDAGLEVVAILAYEGPSTRAQIDYIRGVNSSSTIRTLLSRRLIERAGNPEDGREYLYRPTVELLAYLGVSEVRELPDYEAIAQELRAFKTNRTAFDEALDNGAAL